LSGHKNIIEYVDHQLVLGKTGVYDYMLLTTYYPGFFLFHNLILLIEHFNLFQIMFYN